MHQGQHRPSPGCSKVRQIRTGIRLFKPASQGYLGARAFLCRRGETARARLARRHCVPPRGRERRLIIYHSPTCVHPVHAPIRPCPAPAPACIVLHRAAPRCAAARTPRTGYCGRRRRSDRPFRTGLQRWLGRKRRLSPKPPSFMSSLNPFIFSTLKSFFGRRVRSWLRTNAGGAPNTCKSRG